MQRGGRGKARSRLHLDHFHRIGSAHEVFAIVTDQRLALGFGGSDLAVGTKRSQRSPQLVPLDVERFRHGALRAELLPRHHGANGEDDRVKVGRIRGKRGERTHIHVGTGLRTMA